MKNDSRDRKQFVKLGEYSSSWIMHVGITCKTFLYPSNTTRCLPQWSEAEEQTEELEQRPSMNQSYRGGRAWIGWITHYRDVCVSVCVGAQACLYKYISQYICISVDVLG